MNKQQVHPLNPAEKIFGRVVQIGEVLQKGDVYDAPSGKWESIPKNFIGTAVKKSNKSTYIRAVI